MLAQVLKPKPDTAPKVSAMTEKLGLSTVPAAWPTGMAQLTQAYAACQRCIAEEAAPTG